MAEDKRKQPRQRTLQTGRLVFNGAWSTLDCTVCDLSAGGARLRFPTAFELPADFELMVLPKRRRLPARIAWLRGPEVGVAFD